MLSTMARRQAKTPVHGDLSGGAPALGGSNEEGGGSGAGQEGGKPARKPSARKPEQDGSEPPQKKSSVKEAGREGEKEEDTPGAAEGENRSMDGRFKSPSQLKCSLCSEDFSSSALLTDHMRSHASAPRPTSISATASVTAHTSPAKPFECPHSSCFKSFATFRGLCKHWEYEPTHRPPPTPTQPKLTSPPLARPSQLPSEPATQSEPTSPHVPIEGSPAQSPTSMPGSPSSRASMRFHSIIRTRRTSSNTEQMAEVGTKRSHSETSSPSALPSAKAMQLTSGERESVGTEDESVGGGEDEKKPHKGSHRPRTRSSSGPENPPTPVKSSFSSGDLSRSPRTRSSTAKASVEFAELPMRKKRKKRGRPRLVSKDSSAAAQDGHKKAKLEKTESKTESKEKAAASQELPATQPPVVKRKRGRPPKRKDPPPPAVPSTTGATTTVSTPARTTSASAVPPSPSSGKTTSSSASEGTKMKRSAVRQQDKSPAPSSESKGGARKRGSSSTLPPWESITDKEETSSSKAGSVQLHSLLSKSSDKEKELPELPAIQPSIVPPSGTSTAVAIPSILPQSHALSEAQANTPPNGATRSSSSSSAIDCSYVTMNKSMANSVVSSAGSDKQVRDGAATSKSRDDKEELEIIEVKRATRNVEIDLTKDEEVETAVSKGKAARRDSAGRREGAEEERGKPPPQHRPSSVIVNVLSSVGGAKGGDSKEAEHARLPLEDTDREEEKTEVRRRLSMDGMPTPPPLPPPQITPYPPGSTPTPTYSPYPYPMPYPPPPLMFPPGAPPYPYYGYPSVSQPHMPGAYIPSGPSMMPHPHAPPSHMEQTMEAMYSNTSAPVMTTVSGVRVSVLDKPPTHLSAVSPHQIPTASGRPRSTPGMYMDQQSPPVAMDMTRGPHPHPLSQTYRSGGMVPPGGPYFPPPQSYHNVSVRLDHSGVPYVDWGRRWQLSRQWAAVTIQRAVREWLCRRRACRVRESRESTRNRAAATIQHHWRLYIAERRRYESTYAKLRARLEQERLATGVILSELRSQAQGVQLPMAIKSRSFSQPTPSSPNPRYLLQVSANPPLPIFPSGSLLFPSKPRKPLLKMPPTISVVERQETRRSVLFSIPESAEEGEREERFPSLAGLPSLTSQGQSSLKAILPSPIGPQSSARVHQAASGEDMHRSSSRSSRAHFHKVPRPDSHDEVHVALQSTIGSASGLKPDCELPSLEAHVLDPKHNTQQSPQEASSPTKLPPLPKTDSLVSTGASCEELIRARQASSSELTTDLPPLKLPGTPDAEETREGIAPEPLEQVDGSRAVGEMRGLEQGGASTARIPMQSYITRQTTFKDAPLGYKPTQRERRANDRDSIPADHRLVLQQVERYDKLNQVLSLLHRAKEKKEEGGGEEGGGEVRLRDLKHHIETALDEAIRLRADTEVMGTGTRGLQAVL